MCAGHERTAHGHILGDGDSDSGDTLIDERMNCPSPIGVSGGDTSSDGVAEDVEDPDTIHMAPRIDAARSGEDCSDIGWLGEVRAKELVLTE